ncbi:LysM peptidoglycan-binding domain-containing protein [Heliobacillus mobilis]|uniref:LysM peptidoglycan-binding domain-containing protein n=1 Tax=Heliobacterium mobile TaxID=28064 RepID=A0A6I3SMX3_HELMO|nr:LysM peptidoglycan-binding domain-containing protein [Heliobacterium mobile]MTV50358.1 LysM peptidoglycan-binding domain-containing protein [Heliobacterium mobile]
MALSKAKIIAYRGSGTDTIEVLFNPNAYSLQSKNNFAWDNSPGLSAPIGQFINGGATTLTMELFVDTYEMGTDVREKTGQITGLMEVDSELHTPPICRFVWGSLDFKGVIENISQRYTMFLDSGIPVRATLNVTFQACENVTEQLQKTPRHSSDRTKERILKQGEQLWMIAGEEFNNPGQWRELAKANSIDNPHRLVPGTKLVVPRLR